MECNAGFHFTAGVVVLYTGPMERDTGLHQPLFDGWQPHQSAWRGREEDY